MSCLAYVPLPLCGIRSLISNSCTCCFVVVVDFGLGVRVRGRVKAVLLSEYVETW
jgi:hypothetical protein